MDARHSALAALGLAALLLQGCMRYSEVELVGVRDARLTRFDGKGISAVIAVEVYNPNSYRIQLSEPDVDLLLNGMPLGKAVMDSALVLVPNSTQVYQIPLHATVNPGTNWMPLLLGTAMGGTLHLQAKGTVLAKAKMVRKRFPFELEQDLDLR